MPKYCTVVLLAAVAVKFVSAAAVLKPSNDTLEPAPIIVKCMRKLGESGARYIKLMENASDINDTVIINSFLTFFTTFTPTCIKAVTEKQSSKDNDSDNEVTSSANAGSSFWLRATEQRNSIRKIVSMLKMYRKRCNRKTRKTL